MGLSEVSGTRIVYRRSKRFRESGVGFNKVGAALVDEFRTRTVTVMLVCWIFVCVNSELM